MKFLDTNLTVDSFVRSLRNTKDNLPKTLEEWLDIDEELKEEYTDQLSWLLEKAAEFIEKESKASIWCEGCGEPRYKCYCDEDCPYCDKKLKDCIGDSETGECPNKPHDPKYGA